MQDQTKKYKLSPRNSAVTIMVQNYVITVYAPQCSSVLWMVAERNEHGDMGQLAGLGSESCPCINTVLTLKIQYQITAHNDDRTQNYPMRNHVLRGAADFHILWNKKMRGAPYWLHFAKLCTNLRSFAKCCENWQRYAQTCWILQNFVLVADICRDLRKLAEACSILLNFAQIRMIWRHFAQNCWVMLKTLF